MIYFTGCKVSLPTDGATKQVSSSPNTVPDLQVKLLNGPTTVKKPKKPSQSFTSSSFDASQD